MKKTLLTLSTLALLMSGCSNITPSFTQKNEIKLTEINPAKKAKFQNDFNAVAQKTKTDPKYHKMGLKPDDRKWFKNLTYTLWNRDMSQETYIQEGLTRYPNNRYEFTFVASNL